jgi:hypothetical protein
MRIIGVNVARVAQLFIVLTVLLNAFSLVAQPLPLTIAEDTMPPLDAGVAAHIILHARGGVPPYRWSIASGELPEGLSLKAEGVVDGRPVKPGQIVFTVAVEDSVKNRITKELRTVVTGSLQFSWFRPPQVRGDRMEGSVQLSNGTKDDFDLTLIVVAIAENGRATVLGYQHFSLKSGTNDFQIPFSQSLPQGAYIVHADAVAEIASKNTILKRLLESPAPIPVTQGP